MPNPAFPWSKDQLHARTTALRAFNAHLRAQKTLPDAAFIGEFARLQATWATLDAVFDAQKTFLNANLKVAGSVGAWKVLNGAHTKARREFSGQEWRFKRILKEHPEYDRSVDTQDDAAAH